ncbi:hypothetical protein E4191_19025 (plasmid) [Paracoccus liaowanqingii]|uniref:Uncharacterized protein n=1 Tax=Paracoccus liaowanqingii TaxID=2560053 RepID=A0A4Y5STZ1_9RHOB|nr:hypothetical protein [Paracoccus liaowanqingii]QDA36216.1 hypothetical protein E4191_19025 [Paracoccus liaowanqingii]
MSKTNFEDEIAALLNRIYASSPRDRYLVAEQLRTAVTAIKLPTLREDNFSGEDSLLDLDEEDPFNNVPV